MEPVATAAVVRSALRLLAAVARFWRTSRRMLRWVYVVIVLISLYLTLMAGHPWTAAAWELSKSTNGVVLIPQSGDATGTYEASIRYDYKGGSEFSSMYDPTAFGSYNATKVYYQFAYPGSVRVASVEMPLVPGYRIQRVTLNNTDSAKEDYLMVVLNEPLSVAVTGTASVDVTGTTPVSVTGTPTVSMAGTASVSLDASASTLTVDPWKVAGMPDDWLLFIVTLGVFVSGVGTAYMFAGRKRSV